MKLTREVTQVTAAPSPSSKRGKKAAQLGETLKEIRVGLDSLRALMLAEGFPGFFTFQYGQLERVYQALEKKLYRLQE